MVYIENCTRCGNQIEIGGDNPTFTLVVGFCNQCDNNEHEIVKNIIIGCVVVRVFTSDELNRFNFDYVNRGPVVRFRNNDGSEFNVIIDGNMFIRDTYYNAETTAVVI